MEPLARPRGAIFNGSGVLWHVSLEAYEPEQVIGSYDPTRHWLVAMEDDAKKAVEELLEEHRPKEAPSRRAVVYVTDWVPLVCSFAKTHPDSRIYWGRADLRGQRWGRVDMRYIDYMASRGPTPDHACAYWQRKPSPSGVCSWEILLERFQVEGEVSREKRAQFVATPFWRDPDRRLILPSQES